MLNLNDEKVRIFFIDDVNIEFLQQRNSYYKIKFTTEDIGVVRDADTLYTQFGDYITSITPAKFTAKVSTIGYIDKVFNQPSFNMLQYIDQNGAKLPYDDPSRTIDFSANNTVNFSPVIYGNLDADHNTFAAPEVDFIYFYFIPFYFYQEVELPVQYAGVSIDMFAVPGDPNQGTIDGTTLKVKHYQMIKKILPNAKINNMIYYTFGNCDSTYVVNPNAEYVGISDDSPVANSEDNLVIRSNLYDKMIYHSPTGGENAVMNGALSMNTNNLIQIYAGVDNIPYTSDDVFVYAPRYWERLTARLDTE